MGIKHFIACCTMVCDLLENEGFLVCGQSGFFNDLFFKGGVIMSKKLVILICFALVLCLSNATWAEPITVPNFSFELDKFGDPLTDYWYDDMMVLLGWLVDDEWGGSWTGITQETAYHGFYSVQGYSTGGSVYQVLSHPLIAERRYTLNFDAACVGNYANSGDQVFAKFFYDAGGGSHVDIASVTLDIPPVSVPEDPWLNTWYPHLTLSFNSLAGQPYLGENLGIKIGFPDTGPGPGGGWNLLDNVRLDESPLELAWNPNPSQAAINVAVDVNEASTRYMKLIIGVTSFAGWRGFWMDTTPANLTWEAGDYADQHVVWFSTDFNDVYNRVEDANKGRQSGLSYDPGPLELGQTYYWAIDEVNTTTSTVWEGQVWDFTVMIGLSPEYVKSIWDNGQGNNLWCEPNNWDPDGLPTVTSWTTWAGGDNASIDIPSIPSPALISSGCDAECTYIFVGEYNDVGHGLDITGGTFTTMEIAIGDWPGANATMTMSGGIVDLLHWSRLSVGREGTGTFTMTGGEINALGTTWQGTEVDYAGMVAVPYGGGSGHFQFDGGLIRARQLYMETGGRMDITGGTMILTHNLYAPDWPEIRRVNWWYGQGWITAYGDEGILDVAVDDSNTIITAYPRDPDLAWNPSPRDHDPDATMWATLSWSPGAGAAGPGRHRLYFSTDFKDVSDRDLGVLTTLDVNYFNPGTLQMGEQHFWCVDETDGVTTWPGYLWTFTVAEFLTIDDMGSYDASVSLIADTWIDSWAPENDSTSEILLETSDANYIRDEQSMKYSFENSDSPYYAETKASIADLQIGSDWTEAKALVLYFRADITNEASAVQPMSVFVSDGVDTGTVKYDDPNDLIRGRDGWQEWNIELQDFADAGVDMTNVTEMGIVIGDGNEAGDGYVYFDDITIWSARCVPDYSFPLGDFTGDCSVDYFDIDTISRDWLLSGYDVVATEPSDANLVGHWPLDDNISFGDDALIVVDSTGNYDGALFDENDDPGQSTASHSTTGIVEPNLLAFTFDGWDDYIEIPALNLNSNTVTMSAWVKRDGEFSGSGIVYCRDANTTAGLSFGTTGDPDWAANNILGYSWNDDEATWGWGSGLFIPDMQWTFVALAVEPTKAELYLYDGTLQISTNQVSHDIEEFDGPLLIGYDNWWEPFKGAIDDVRIYDHILSASEIAYLALQGPGIEHVSLKSWRADADDNDKVDFGDYAIMADYWLQEVLFPLE